MGSAQLSIHTFFVNDTGLYTSEPSPCALYGSFIYILPRKCKSGPMPPSWAKIGDKCQQVQRYSLVCPWGQPPGMADDKCITFLGIKLANYH